MTRNKKQQHIIIINTYFKNNDRITKTIREFGSIFGRRNVSNGSTEICENWFGDGRNSSCKTMKCSNPKSPRWRQESPITKEHQLDIFLSK